MTLYEPQADQIDALIRARPFALVISEGDSGGMVTPLPLMLEGSASLGGVLVGHFARTNPHVAQLMRRPRATFVFSGVDGYISPSWLSDRTQAPTWNYQLVQLTAEVVIRPGHEEAIAAVDRLSAQLESGRPRAWSPSEMGPRHARLCRGVVAFSAEIQEVRARFKLGQNEKPDVYGEILEGLRRSGAGELHDAMVEANARP